MSDQSMQPSPEEPIEQITTAPVTTWEQMEKMYDAGLISEEKYHEFLASMREVTIRMTQYRAYPVEDLEF